MRIAIAALAIMAGMSFPAFADDLDDLLDGMVDDAIFDDHMCDIVSNVQAQLQPQLPIQGKDGRVTYGVVANCERRSLTFQRAYDFPESQLKRGWYDVVSREWSKSSCTDKNTADAVRNGWRFTQTLKFKTGKVYSMDVKC